LAPGAGDIAKGEDVMVAESGKARYVPVEKLEPGMKVHKDVLGRRGTPLVNAGEVITRAHVDKLKKWENQPEPAGNTLPRKSKTDPIQKAAFKGGYKVSHFNPRGILVSATLASGEDEPEVVRDPTKSPVVQAAGRSSFAVGDVGVESPLLQELELKADVRAAEKINARHGGTLHTLEKQPATREELRARLESLETQNAELLDTKRDAKPGVRTRKKA
jgi:hypothetical protein